MRHLSIPRLACGIRTRESDHEKTSARKEQITRACMGISAFLEASRYSPTKIIFPHPQLAKSHRPVVAELLDRLHRISG